MQLRRERSALSCLLVTACRWWVGRKTHNEPTALVVDVSLQQSLTQISDMIGAIILRTNLIVHHGITDIFNQATKFIHILSTIQEPCDFPPFCQWDEVLENTIQFPIRVC